LLSIIAPLSKQNGFASKVSVYNFERNPTVKRKNPQKVTTINITNTIARGPKEYISGISRSRFSIRPSPRHPIENITTPMNMIKRGFIGYFSYGYISFVFSCAIHAKPAIGQITNTVIIANSPGKLIIDKRIITPNRKKWLH